MATIGELIINLNANTASFVTDLNRVKNLSFATAKQVQRSFSLIGTAALGMLGTFAAAAVAMVDRTVELETHILHLAASSGVTVETLSGMAFVARMLGMDIDKVAVGMERFDRTLINAQLGIKQAVVTMGLFGIDPATIKTSDDALKIMADHFHGMADGALKTGEAMLAFGKAGAQMIPILNLGSAGMQKSLDMAKALGLVFSKEDAEGALAFKQNITILEASFEGFQIQLEKALLPSLNALTDVFIEQSKTAGNYGTTIDSLKFSFQVMASALIFTISEIKELANEVQAPALTMYALAIVNAFKAIGAAAIGDFGTATAAIQDMKDEFALAALQNADTAARSAAIQIETGQRLNAVWDATPKSTENTRKAIAALSADVKDKGAKAVEAFTKSIGAMITSLKTQAATIGMTAVQIELYKIKTDAARLGVDALGASLSDAYVKAQKHLDLEQQYAALRTSGEQERQKNSLAYKLQSDTEDLAVMAQQLDVMTRMTNIPTAPLGTSTGPNDAFTNSLNAQMKALTDAEFAIGKTGDQMAIFNLLQKDGSAAALAMIPALEAEQQKLAGMQAAANATAEAAKRNADAWKMFGNVALKSFEELIFDGKKFTQVLADITKQLGEMFLKWALFGFGDKSTSGGGGFFGMLAGLMGLGGGGAGVEGSAFLPLSPLFFGLAAGGPVAAGQTVMVGENGPEIFTPSTAGAIIPNGGGSGGGPQVNVVYQIDARGSSITEAQFQRSLAISENRAVRRALNNAREIQLRTA